MKTLDVVVAAIVVIGGLNWGLVGFFNFNLVAWIFGDMEVAARITYALVGLAALYEIAMMKAAPRRWGVSKAA
jgi:uncharacterized protein